MSRMRETQQQEAGQQLPANDIGVKSSSKKSTGKKDRKPMSKSGHK